MVFLLISLTGAEAQNLFDYSHSISYSLNLIEHKEYELAYRELQRMVVEDKVDNDTVAILFLKVCYLTGRNREMMVMVDSLSRQVTLSEGLSNHLIGICLSIDSFQLADQLIDRRSNSLTGILPEYKLLSLLFQNKYTEGQLYYNDHKHQLSDTLFFADLLQQKREAKTKSKALAVVLSTLIPASGKYYLGEYYDATVGLALTSIYAILSIRAFSIAGAGSVFGWVNVGAFTTFYIGNIIGTAKAADRYNHKINQTIKGELKNKLHTLSGI